VARAIVTVACLAVLTACSNGSADASTDPVEEGWKIRGVDRAIDMETVTPEVSGTIVNNYDAVVVQVFTRETTPDSSSS